MKRSEKRQRLKNAIRAFTVDAGRFGMPRPNGPAELAWRRLSDALLALPDPQGQRIAGLAVQYLDEDLERLTELRQAADQFFGEDFKRPEGGREVASPAPDGPPSEGAQATKTFAPRLSLLARLEIWWSTSVLHRLELIGLREPTCYCYYGSFPGGDPRDFRPDPDNATAELAEHRVLCAAWAAGQQDRPDIGLGLGTALCEHHRRVPRPPPRLLRARRRVLTWLSRKRATPAVMSDPLLRAAGRAEAMFQGTIPRDEGPPDPDHGF